MQTLAVTGENCFLFSICCRVLPVLFALISRCAALNRLSPTAPLLSRQIRKQNRQVDKHM